MSQSLIVRISMHADSGDAVPTERETTDQIAENLRFYGNARFQQLTLFMGGLSVITAGIVHERATNEFMAGLSLRAVLAIFGMLFTAVIWVMEVRCTIYWTIHWSRARHVWPL